MKTSIIKSTASCEIVSSRVLNASQEMVYKAWTDPVHLINWWGPAGFTNTFNEYDFRKGGKWSFIMHGPNQDHYPNECVFIKIDEPRLLAFNHLSKPEFQVVATFEKFSDDNTEVVFKMIFDSPEECSEVRTYAVDKNEENFDRLELELKRKNNQ